MAEMRIDDGSLRVELWSDDGKQFLEGHTFNTSLGDVTRIRVRGKASPVTTFRANIKAHGVEEIEREDIDLKEAL